MNFNHSLPGKRNIIMEIIVDKSKIREKLQFFSFTNSLLIIIIMFSFITCCAVQYRLKQGENLQLDKIACLICHEESPVRLLSVDGKKPSLGNYFGFRRNPFIWGLFGQLEYMGFEMELIPGKHILIIDYCNTKGYTERSIESIELAFFAWKVFPILEF